jgi:hypothetical protein
MLRPRLSFPPGPSPNRPAQKSKSGVDLRVSTECATAESPSLKNTHRPVKPIPQHLRTIKSQLTHSARSRRRSSPVYPAYRSASPSPEMHSGQRSPSSEPRSRIHTTREERGGKSRREAKKDAKSNRSPEHVAGRLGKHVLHW